MRRPVPKIRDFEKLANRLQTADGVAYETSMGNRVVKYRNNSVEGVSLSAASHDLYKTRVFNFSDGRYFTEIESRAGSPVAILGYTVADGLFPNESPIGKTIKVLGRRVTVIGIFEKEGEDMLGISADKLILLPLNFTRNVINVEDERYDPQITVKGLGDISINEVESELRGTMRSIRRINPRDDDDFALNKSTILTAQLDQMF
jgi:putative ABC transport system permease protein